jgi:hypothetical protein
VFGRERAANTSPTSFQVASSRIGSQSALTTLTGSGARDPSGN